MASSLAASRWRHSPESPDAPWDKAFHGDVPRRDSLATRRSARRVLSHRETRLAARTRPAGRAASRRRAPGAVARARRDDEEADAREDRDRAAAVVPAAVRRGGAGRGVARPGEAREAGPAGVRGRSADRGRSGRVRRPPARPGACLDTSRKVAGGWRAVSPPHGGGTRPNLPMRHGTGRFTATSRGETVLPREKPRGESCLTVRQDSPRGHAILRGDLSGCSDRVEGAPQPGRDVLRRWLRRPDS